jgi:hypothetical protein
MIWFANVLLLIAIYLLGKRTSVLAARVGWALNCSGDLIYVIVTGHLQQWSYFVMSVIFTGMAAWNFRCQFSNTNASAEPSSKK